MYNIIICCFQCWISSMCFCYQTSWFLRAAMYSYRRMPCICAPVLATANDTEPMAKLPCRTGFCGSTGGNGFSTILLFLPVIWGKIPKEFGGTFWACKREKKLRLIRERTLTSTRARNSGRSKTSGLVLNSFTVSLFLIWPQSWFYTVFITQWPKHGKF